MKRIIIYKRKAKSIVDLFLNNKEYLKPRKSIFKGNVLLFTANKAGVKDIKILDTEGHKVLSNYNQKEDYAKILESYKFFRPYYNIPKIIYHDIYKRIICYVILQLNWQARFHKV